MGRKKQSVQEASEAKAPEIPSKPPKLASVCRAALDRFGGDVAVAQVRSFIADHYKGYVYNEETLSATLSNQRKRYKKDAGHDQEPSAQDVMLVAQLVAARQNFPQELEEMQRTIESFGGLKRLRRCLRALEDISSAMGKGAGG